MLTDHAFLLEMIKFSFSRIICFCQLFYWAKKIFWFRKRKGIKPESLQRCFWRPCAINNILKSAMMSHRVQPITKTIDLHKHNLWEMKNRKYMQKIEIKIKMDLKKVSYLANGLKTIYSLCFKFNLYYFISFLSFFLIVWGSLFSRNFTERMILQDKLKPSMIINMAFFLNCS